MGLLQPESGLLFWTSLSFGIVLLLLCKYAFPVILRAIDERKEFIDSSLKEASAAKTRTLELQQEGDAIISKAEAERLNILKKTKEEQERIASEICSKAKSEAALIIENARKEAENEKKAILQQADNQIVALSVAIAERLLRERLSNDAAQSAFAGQMLDEIKNSREVL